MGGLGGKVLHQPRPGVPYTHFSTSYRHCHTSLAQALTFPSPLPHARSSSTKMGAATPTPTPDTDSWGSCVRRCVSCTGGEGGGLG